MLIHTEVEKRLLIFSQLKSKNQLTLEFLFKPVNGYELPKLETQKSSCFYITTDC